MVVSCCAYGCTQRFVKGSGVKFFVFPYELNRKEAWIRALKRKGWTPNQWSRVCSDHFQTGKPSKDPNHPDFVPNVFVFRVTCANAKNYEARKKRREEKNSMAAVPSAQPSTSVQDLTNTSFQDLGSTSSPSETVQLDCNVEINRLEKENAIQKATIAIQESELQSLRAEIVQLKVQLSARDEEIAALRAEKDAVSEKPITFAVQVFKSDAQFNFYSGLPSQKAFNNLMQIMHDEINDAIKTVPLTSQLLIVLVKIKLNLSLTDIAYRFQTSRRTVTRILDLWIPKLASKLKFLIRWPDAGAPMKHLPSSFSNSVYKDTVAIIDCTEVFIQKPGNQTARAQTWSNYKHHHTIKFFVATTPNGHISFLSQVWGGRASDKEITLNSGFLDFLAPGDVVLADRGFLLEEHFAAKYAKLVIPSRTKGRKQLSLSEVLHSEHVSNVRIHVERVIGQIKRFEILRSTIPIRFLKYIDEVVILCAAFSNLSRSVVT